MRIVKNKIITLATLAALTGAFPRLVLASNGPAAPLPERVRHQLAMLPYLSVFDDLSFRVENGVVTLFGQVTRPVLKSDAEGVVKHLEGVARVDNQIEVLPLSPMDNQIRMREYRAIFGYSPLQRYRLGAIPSIHILVKNGNVTLKGFVSSPMDKQLAYMRANGVPRSFLGRQPDSDRPLRFGSPGRSHTLLAATRHDPRRPVHLLTGPPFSLCYSQSRTRLKSRSVSAHSSTAVGPAFLPASRLSSRLIPTRAEPAKTPVPRSTMPP